MLNKYNCQVQPRLDSKLFPYFEQALGRRRILDKWFYFYKNNPTNPVVIWKSKYINSYQLQPGTNRYIGTALRSSDEWISGVYITDDLIKPVDELKILNLYESVELHTNYPNFYNITLDNPTHRWGVAGQTLYDPSWIQPVYDWIHANVKYQWGLNYNNTVYYINPERRLSSLFKHTGAIINANDYPTVQQAVQALFKLVV
jgi:hypothetical protein